MKNVFVQFSIFLFLLFPLFICAQFYSDQLEKSEQEFCQSRHNNFSDKLKTSDKNFIISKYLQHNEISQIISYNGLQGRLLLSGANTSYPLARWEAAHTTEYLKMSFYDTNKLIECKYSGNQDDAKHFLEELEKELDEDIQKICSSFQTTNNKFQTVTYNNRNNLFNSKPLKFELIRSSTDMPEGLQNVLSSTSLRNKCSQKDLQQSSEEAPTNADSNAIRKRTVRSVSHWFMVPNTKWCGRGHDASNYTELGGASMADKCCRKHDHCNINIPGFTTKWQLFNYFPFTISHCSCDKRQRRDLSNLLRMPGTEWCGKGWSARKYSHLGRYSKADRCCRQHDKSCPFWISGFQTKYGLFNWRVSTLMHCKCDERFRTCLKMADSADANMVGKLFFNIVQTKCFVFKTEKVCRKHSWRGKCERKELRKRAHIRDNRKF